MASQQTTALACVPLTCPISAAGGKSNHKLINQCGAKLAFKIKCSNNSNYIVSKVYGFVEVAAQEDIEIVRKPGKPKADKLVIQFAEVAADATDPKAPFEPNAPQPTVAGEVVVKLSAAE
ncbi:msp protein [Aphelenchoides avenae]|nr:msp protein [Aphelenchus avenae]